MKKRLAVMEAEAEKLRSMQADFEKGVNEGMFKQNIVF